MPRNYGGNRRTHGDILVNGVNRDGKKVAEIVEVEEVKQVFPEGTTSISVTTGAPAKVENTELSMPPAPASVQVTTGEPAAQEPVTEEAVAPEKSTTKKKK